MREIKFRAWDKELKKWVKEPGKEFFINYYSDINGNKFIIDANTTKYPFEYRYILMQYVGLKDKNGKEIFEGDILDCTCKIINDTATHFKNIVEFWCGNSGVGYRLKGIGTSYTCMLKKRQIANFRAEIIGNIHENSFLLDNNS